MKKKSIAFDLEHYNDISELSEGEQTLVEIAYKEAENSYSPFSKFRVGVSVLLEDGHIVGGSNQENASYPAGICAERVALSVASSLFPNVKPKKIVIVVNDSNYKSEFPCAPCGICRQTIHETESRYGQKIQIIFPGENGSFYKVKSIKSLLPLGFDSNNLK